MLIDNRYLVEEELGRGGMGVVYLCRDQVLHKSVAVKLLQASFDLETQAERFHRESVINAKLKHKNIIEVLDFGQTEKGELFLVSEYLEGETLQAYLKRKGGALALQDALPIFEEICDGLAHAHKHGVLHRDIKPGNIMVLKDRSVAMIKIMDLGIASEENSDEQRLTKPGASLGTPFYVSPEQSLNKPLDLRTDVYSLGCLMFEVLAGAPPYQDESAVETILMHQTKPVPSLKEFGVAECGEEIERVLARCLAKDREERYSSMDELKADLEPLGEVDRWKQTTIAGGAFLRRRGTQNVGWVVLLLALIGLGTAAIWMVAQSERADERSLKKEKLYSGIFIENAPMSVEEKLRRSLEKEYSVSVHEREDGTKSHSVHGNVTDARLRNVVRDLPEIRYLSLHGDDYDGDGFAYLSALHLKGLHLKEDELTDKGLRNLSLLPELEELELVDCLGFTNEGLASFSRSHKLESLIIEGNIDDDSIAAIANIANLQHLGLQNSPGLTGSTIGLLKKLERLDYLELQNSGFQTKYLKELASLDGLRKLDLSGLQIKDQDLPAIATMKLKSLKLEGNNITDAGLKILSRMSSLKTLDLSDCTGITRIGGQNFARARPNCSLEFDPCDRLDLVPERP